MTPLLLTACILVAYVLVVWMIAMWIADRSLRALEEERAVLRYRPTRWLYVGIAFGVLAAPVVWPLRLARPVLALVQRARVTLAARGEEAPR